MPFTHVHVMVPKAQDLAGKNVCVEHIAITLQAVFQSVLMKNNRHGRITSDTPTQSED